MKKQDKEYLHFIAQSTPDREKKYLPFQAHTMSDLGKKYIGFNSRRVGEIDMQHLRFIAQNIVDRRCILFLGAGANMCGPENESFYQREFRPPTGTELASTLYKEIKDSVTDPSYEYSLSRVAQYYEVKKGGRLGLARALRQHVVHNKKPSPLLYHLAEIPFQYIITTNYDLLFEEALRAKMRNPHIGIYKPDRKKPDKVKEVDICDQRPFLFKIHGDINIDESIVITDEDYIRFVQRMRDTNAINPIPVALDKALAKNSILFIGYRLMDYNLRLLLKTIRWGRDVNTTPLNYSIDPSPDSLIQKISDINYQTKFIVSDAWKIIPLLKAIVWETIVNNQ